MKMFPLVAALLGPLAAANSWVLPQGLPEGHNGGFRERIVDPVADVKPHIVLVLFDDYGWADAGWHRNYTGPGGTVVPYTKEVQTPNLNALVQEGIELDRAYVYKYCSPTRSAIQSGRNPYHVNPLNAAPDISNPADPVSGFAAIPRNMTGIATKMAAAGYKTGGFGKWDAGMATPDHTPHGRGYQTAMNYFHHANDYWSMAVGGCSGFGPTPAPQPKLKCMKHYQSNFCLGASPNLKALNTASPEDCCGHCSDTPGCKGWAWGKSRTHNGNHTCFLKSEIRPKDKGNCTSKCMHANCFPEKVPVTDLWRAAPGATEGPAIGWNNTCKKAPNTPEGERPQGCDAGPRGDHWFDGYEDAVFEQQVLSLVDAHDPKDRLFLFWAPHIVHAPLQVPKEYSDRFAFMADTDKPTHNRQRYHAMVNFADAAVGNLTTLLKAKGMWEETLLVFTTDNGGPIYANGSAGANNYPLKGGKMNNWEGGIRGNSFASGGFIPSHMRGHKYDGLVTAWDWYHTFCRLAGVDPTDHRAAAAHLPPLDSFDHSGLILGTNLTSPRTELPIGTEPRASNVSTAPSCGSYGASPLYEDEAVDGDEFGPMPSEGNCTTVSGLIVDERGSGGTLWKILTGDVQQDVFMGPHYPNSTTDEISNNFVGHCANGCLFDLVADPQERKDLASSHADKLKQLQDRLAQYESTAFNPDRGHTNPAACEAAFHKYEGFWGPFLP